MLRTEETLNSLPYSYLHWSSGVLQLGTPSNVNSNNYVDIKPGGYSGTALSSLFRMYSTTASGAAVQKIELNTNGDCWLNTGGNLGIGTTTPSAKLDVRGTIRGTDLKLLHPTNSSGPEIQLRFQGNSWFYIQGNLGIGTKTPAYLLDVNGTLHAKEIIVSTPGADFVFEEGYELMPLGTLSEYVKTNHHLPEIQSAEEMQEEGVSVSELQTKLLQKVEELTLYILQQQEVIDELKSEINELKE